MQIAWVISESPQVFVGNQFKLTSVGFFVYAGLFLI